jgi:3,4-dihydroxy-2-butanone 4-phosphate synthase
MPREKRAAPNFLEWVQFETGSTEAERLHLIECEIAPQLQTSARLSRPGLVCPMVASQVVSREDWS